MINFTKSYSLIQVIDTISKIKEAQRLSLEVQHTEQKPGLNHGHLLKQIVFCQTSKT